MSWVSSGWPSTCSGLGSSWDRFKSSGNQEAVSCRRAIRIIWTPGDWTTFCRTWGTISNGGNAYRRPLPLSQGTDMASVKTALRSGYGDANLMRRLLANVVNRLTWTSPHLANTGRRRSMTIVHSVFSVWPTLDSESAWTLCTPDRWTETSFITLRSHHFSRRIVSCMRVKDWVPPSFLMYATVTALSHIKQTTWHLRWERNAVTALETAFISRMLMCHDLWVPVSSVTLTGLPNPSWTPPWRQWLPFPWQRGMPTRPPQTAPIEELWCCRPISRSSGTKLWRPTTGLDEDGVFPVVPAKP